MADEHVKDPAPPVAVASDGAGVSPPGEKTGEIPWGVVLAMVIAGFMAILDGSIVNVALPKMMAVFSVGTQDIQWVMTSYLLVGGVVVPITGYLGVRYGMKRMFIVSLAIFTFGSFICAMAWSNNSLVFARVVQAVGGGMLMPIGMAVMFMEVPRDKVGVAIGVWGISSMAAPAIGPTLGGYLVDNFSWHWIFMINVPVGLAAMVMTTVVLTETPRRVGMKPDIIGMILSTVAFFSLLLALSQGQDKGWTSLYIVNLLLLSGFTMVLFVIWELDTKEPLLDLKLLKNTAFTVSLIGTAIVTVGMFSVIFLIPMFTQRVLEFTPMRTGLLMMPMAITMGIMMPISGKLYDKVGALPLCLVGLSLTALTTYNLHHITIDTSFRALQLLLVERAVGLGMCMMPITTVGMNAVPQFLVSQASAMSNLVRQVSASFGIAVITYIMVKRQGLHAAWMADGVNMFSPTVASTVEQLQAYLSLNGIDGGAAPAVLYSLIAKQALVAGITDTILVSVLIICSAIPLAFFLSKRQVAASLAADFARYADTKNY